MAGRIPSLAECSQRITMGGEEFAYKSEADKATRFEGFQVSTKLQISIKRVPQNLNVDSKGEVEILKSFSHRNIVNYVKDGRVDNCHWIVMTSSRGEPLCGQSFNNIGEIKNVVRQIFEALGYLDKVNVIHYGLDFQNICWCSKEKQLTLTDFGFAKRVGTPFKGECNFRYAAPEILFEKEPHSTAVDLWSAGCLIYELIGHEVLYVVSSHDTRQEQVRKSIDQIVDLIGPPSPQYFYGAKNPIEIKPSPLPREGLTDEFRKDFSRKLEDVGSDEEEHGQWANLLESLLSYQKRRKAVDYLNNPLFRVE